MHEPGPLLLAGHNTGLVEIDLATRVGLGRVLDTEAASHLGAQTLGVETAHRSAFTSMPKARHINPERPLSPPLVQRLPQLPPPFVAVGPSTISGTQGP